MAGLKPTNLSTVFTLTMRSNEKSTFFEECSYIIIRSAKSSSVSPSCGTNYGTKD